jgi:hypothetical protein
MTEPMAAFALIGLFVGVLVAVNRFCKRYVGMSLLRVIGFVAFIDWLSGR